MKRNYTAIGATVIGVLALTTYSRSQTTAPKPAAAVKIAVVAMRDAMLATQEGQKAGREMQAKFAPKQSALEQLGKEEATGNAGLKFLYQRELDQVQTIKNQLAEGQSYIPKLVLSDVDMKMSSSRVPGIFGKIANTGDKAIDEDICTVTYFEGKGKKKKSVYTEDHTIVATPMEFINFVRTVVGKSRVGGGAVISRTPNSFLLNDGYRAVPVSDLG